MTDSFSSLRINPDRMLDTFNQLALIGATGDGGVNRPTFSEAHLAARKWFREQIEASGLEFRTDGAGNHSAVLTCKHSNAPTLLLGSHLDSVPKGGRFDGALGVMAALEVLRTVKESGINLRLNLEAIDFTDEEGTHLSLFGSSALSGHLHPEDLKNPYSGRENFTAGLARSGLTEDGLFQAKRAKESLAGYLELHIEQGKRLERAKIDIGIVSAIVGYGSYRMSYVGRADHAGSTTMEDRRDAGQGVAAFILAARETVMRDFPNCVANVGKIEFAPGASNIVPARADFLLEFRSPDEDQLAKLDATLMTLAKEKAEQFGLQLIAEPLGKHLPNLMSTEIQEAFKNSCDDLKLSSTVLASGAIHDAQSLVDVCPIGMIFVPSVDGASHAPREFTKWEDCVNGANVLLQTVLRLAAG
ncbi:Zn-dependent hydrolase [Candidatus Villigracilis affinis]|uniref:Zn-dependent hydrolase n=1 Tax=Candidatus Villigracilis affinis TaxID=3140682 RepID=UPI001D3A5689|nr:Zn-dependent hydrolase [Anaerolineales bacterium]